MAMMRVDEDTRPLSEFRARVASFVRQVQETRRPMVLTQTGAWGFRSAGCARI